MLFPLQLLIAHNMQ